MSPSRSDKQFSLSGGLRLDDVCDRFEAAWRARKRPRIEDFLSDWPKWQQASLLHELLKIEYGWRIHLGEAPAVDEYQARFPWAAEQIAAMFAAVSQASDDFPSHETVGDTLPYQVGHYRILKPLGTGGFGTVYLAWDEKLERKVAVKVPRSDRIHRPEDAERYLEEAQIVAKLDHPNIVPVYDAGRASEGVFYVVSKWIEGSSLAHVLRETRPPPYESAELIAKIADALQHAHGHKLTHRDVKPANIIIDSGGEPYLVDFGLALTDEAFGKHGATAGTLLYMSPEQARGEGHLVDGRSDIFSLGVVFYELLTGERPFRGSPEDVLHQILMVEPRPPRQLDASIPRELERICLKAISKRASDRYTAALDMADDLRHYLVAAEKTPREPAMAPPQKPAAGAPKIVPKGLRSFDELDADFFLELLPGPRDREGLPEVVRFWKMRIAERDVERTFRIGLMYGPSGCGKSSLVKAGLIPNLGDEIVTLYLELNGEDDEQRILSALRRRIPSFAPHKTLVEALAALRRGRGATSGKKVVIILDQFEQWLHRNTEPRHTELVAALRQCDGQNVQCILLARDDFWMATTRFMHEVDVPIVERGNSAAVDLFDPLHARKVLSEFGRAFGHLPAHPEPLSKEQEQFLDLAIADLLRDGKIVPVRLALLADIVRGRKWLPETLTQLGGTQGVTITFLDETFEADTAPPQHRLHQRAARAVLAALLPDGDATIKGHMRSHAELLQVSGYKSRPDRFAELMRILDNETRLLTPVEAEPDGSQTDPVPPPGAEQMYYHLTHDHLVQPLREWLTRQERATRRGRARLLLGERTQRWITKRESRQLPSWWEYATIRLFTSKTAWSPAEAQLMQAARRHLSVRGVVYGFVVLPLLLFVATYYADWRSRQVSAERLVQQLISVNTPTLPSVLDDLEELRRPLLPKLNAALAGVADDSVAQIHLIAALIKLGESIDEQYVHALGNHLLRTDADAFDALRPYLPHQEQFERDLWRVLQSEDETRDRRFRAACILATCQACDPRGDSRDWSPTAGFLADYLLEEFKREPRQAAIWQKKLAPVRVPLLKPLAAAFGDANEDVSDRHRAAGILAKYAEDVPEVLSQLLLDADPDQFAVLFPVASRHKAWTMDRYRDLLEQSRVAGREEAALSSQQANAAVSLLLWRVGEPVWPMFRQSPNPEARSYLIHRLAPLGADVHLLHERLLVESDVSARRALILSLGEFPAEALSQAEKSDLVATLLNWYRDETDSGVHAAAEWLLRKWEQSDVIAEVVADLAQDESDDLDDRRAWYINSQGQTMVVLRDPPVFKMGSPPAEPHREAGGSWELQHQANVGHSFAISAHEVTVQQLEEFARKYYPDHIPKYAEGRLDCPVNMVSWYVGAHYCNWLSGEEGIPEDQWCYIPDRTPPSGFQWTLDEFEQLIRRGFGRHTPKDWADTFQEYVDEVIQSQFQGDRAGLVQAPESIRSQHWMAVFERLGVKPPGLYQSGTTFAPSYFARTGYRLPSEMEWEFACRAGTITIRHYGDAEELLDRYAWYARNTKSVEIFPVGRLKPNDLGLFDVHGNLAEWCQDPKMDYPEPGAQPRMDAELVGRIGAGDRMARGGKFSDQARFVRSANRSWGGPNMTYESVGLRIARSLPDDFAEK